eukprot:Gb_08955 [translate_table: standard]
MSKEEEQIFPLLTQHFSFKEQASLVWQFMCSIPVNLMEEFLPWLVSSPSIDNWKDMIKCMRKIVLEKEFLQEVVFTWLTEKSSCWSLLLPSLGTFHIDWKAYQEAAARVKTRPRGDKSRPSCSKDGVNTTDTEFASAREDDALFGDLFLDTGRQAWKGLVDQRSIKNTYVDTFTKCVSGYYMSLSWVMPYPARLKHTWASTRYNLRDDPLRLKICQGYINFIVDKANTSYSSAHEKANMAQSIFSALSTLSNPPLDLTSTKLAGWSLLASRLFHNGGIFHLRIGFNHLDSWVYLVIQGIMNEATKEEQGIDNLLQQLIDVSGAFWEAGVLSWNTESGGGKFLGAECFISSSRILHNNVHLGHRGELSQLARIVISVLLQLQTSHEEVYEKDFSKNSTIPREGSPWVEQTSKDTTFLTLSKLLVFHARLDKSKQEELLEKLGASSKHMESVLETRTKVGGIVNQEDSGTLNKVLVAWFPIAFSHGKCGCCLFYPFNGTNFVYNRAIT